jgi:hypothetical protein
MRIVYALGLPLLADASAATTPTSLQFAISVINLDKDSVRLASVSAELERAGVPRQQVTATRHNYDSKMLCWPVAATTIKTLLHINFLLEDD